MRRQLTLFISDQNEEIEKIRAEFNPVQFELIAAHVTLCRENELENLEKVLSNIKTISLVKSLQIEFNPAERFADGKGVFIPAKTENYDFHGLRKKILHETQEFNQNYFPHITLMHPRTSTCSDEIFDQIKNCKLPSVLNFDTISLIEENADGRWFIIEQFPLIKSQS